MANPTTQSPRQGNEPRPTGAGQYVTDAKNKAQEAGTSVADKAKDVASSVADKAKDAASTVGHKASDVASSIGHSAEDATSAVGGSMKSLAGTIREKLPHDGMVGSASSAVANTLESGGRYLQEEGLSGIADDLTNMIRRNPIPALLMGIGIGFLIARATTRSYTMANDLRSAAEPSMTSLVSGIINDAQDLLKQQVTLLREEIREDVRKAKEATLSMALGMGIGIIGALLLGHMLAQLLSWGLPTWPLWVCYGIVGGLLVALAGGLLWAGAKKFQSFTSVPTQSIQALKENLTWTTTTPK